MNTVQLDYCHRCGEKKEVVHAADIAVGTINEAAYLCLSCLRDLSNLFKNDDSIWKLVELKKNERTLAMTVPEGILVRVDVGCLLEHSNNPQDFIVRNTTTTFLPDAKILTVNGKTYEIVSMNTFLVERKEIVNEE